jgi:PAS domain S-box-containing protein
MQMDEIEPKSSPFQILGRTSDGVFAVDRAQRIAFWNEAAEQILGFEADRVLGKNCYAVLGGTDEAGCTVCGKRCATFRASLRDELVPTRDVQVRTRAGDRKWVSLTTFRLPSRYQDLALLAHAFRDTSDAHQLQFSLEQLLADAETGKEPRQQPHPQDRLTPREIEVLRLLASGRSTDSICDCLNMQSTTARTHVQHILKKLGVHSRLEAVMVASHNGWLED